MEVPPPAPASSRNGGFAMPPMSPSPSQPSRKEWRVVSEQSVRNSGNEVEIPPCIVVIFCNLRCFCILCILYACRS